MARSAAILCLVCLILAGAVLAAGARVRGSVVDQSGGVLPGVTVTAASLDGRQLATTVTDATGSYAFDGLPPEPITISFQLEGFSPLSADVTVARDGEARVPAVHLGLAGRAETVDVVGKAPSMARSVPPRTPLPPPPPPPVVVQLPEHDRDSVCGPAKTDASVGAFGTIKSRRYGEDKGLYVKDDQVIVEGGALNGLTVGQNVVARRQFRAGSGAGAASGDHTAGVLQIVAAGERASIAVVIYTCDEIMRGDQLAPFMPEPVRAPEQDGMPAFDRAAHILFADAGQLVGAPRRLMVIDRGRDRGFRAGQRLTLFRTARFGSKTPAIVGDAVVVAVRAESATIRVERANDAILFGDLAAPQAPAPATARQQ
jgi:hypothetical protein